MSLNEIIARSTILQVTGKGISTALGLVAVAIMTRTLGTEQFGWYVTATGFLQFIGILIDFGFTVTTSNMLSLPEFDKEKLFNTIFTLRFFSALIFFVLAPLVFLLFPYRTEIKTAVALTSLSFFAITISQVFIGFYRQKLAMLIPTISEVLSRVILVSGILIAVSVKGGFLPIMGVVTIASAAGTIYLWMNFGKIKFELDRTITRSVFHKMWPTATSVIFNAIYLQGDRLILPLYASQSEVGLYGAAYRVLDITIQIAAIVMGIIMPLITFSWSRGLLSEFKERYQLAVDFMSLIILPITAGIFVLSDPIMNLVASENFSGSGLMLKWLSISILGTCFGMIFGHIVLAINRQKEALYIYGSDAIFSLIGYFIFIPAYGWRGAVAVTIFSEVYAGIFLTLLSIYYSKILPELSTLLKIIIASLLMAAVLFYLPQMPLLISILVGMAVYSFFALMFRIIKPESLKKLFVLRKNDAFDNI